MASYGASIQHESRLTLQSTLCCDSAVGVYRHSDLEKIGEKEGREKKFAAGFKSSSALRSWCELFAWLLNVNK